MNELQAITAQLYMVDGVLQEGAIPGLLAQQAAVRPARGRERDYLFVHLTLTGAVVDTADLSQHLLTLISQKYYQMGGSVTAALRGAVLEANQQLLRHNLSVKGQSREGAISCAVFHQGELFTLQAGESIALLGRNFGIERMPPRPPAQLTPLGRSASLDIRYYHHRVQAGDTLLLADPRISHLPTDDFQAALVESSVERGMAELVTTLSGESARLLLVEFSSDASPELPDVTPPVTATSTPAVDPQPRREGVATAVVATTAAERKPQPQRAQPVRQQSVTLAKDSVVDRETMERHARQAGAQAALGASRFTAWLADLLARLRPPQTARTEEPVNWTWAAIIAIVIPLVVAAVVTSVYVTREQSRELAALKMQMSQELSFADVADSEATARQHYRAVLTLAEQANTQLQPGEAEVMRMQTIARTQLDQLEGVTRLTAVPLYQYSEGANLQAVALREGSNGGIFTLDAGSGIVYEHETDPSYLNLTTSSPLRILFNTQTIGSHVVGRMVDFFWRPVGFAVQREGLAVLDAAGALLTYQPDLVSAIATPLDLSAEWVNPVAVTTFGERLYILDTGVAQIWRYFPDGESFTANAEGRTIVFDQDADLGQAVDFDIYSEDGSLVILYNDGRIRYYDTRNGRIEWDENVLLANGLVTPLVNPASVEIVGRGLNATIYIADAGNGRIVQISRPTGQVLAQYRATGEDGAELFTGMTDFAIAELPLRVFVTKGSTLYSATLR
ncbi:MAG: hypothetical protein KJ069_17990 [Anaerolineae bacterium]|nr:hypothetical protein [Anaerolineae bacterium]